MITGSTGIGNGKKFVSVDHDPTAVATDAPKGSLILEESTGRLFCKADDGETTDVMGVVLGLPAGYLNGARMSFNSVSLVDIAAGKVRDSADGEDIVWAGTLTADITASGANGLDTGAEAGGTLYAVFVIAGGGNAVASLLSLSGTAPTLPGTYTVFRRVGWVLNSGSSNFVVFQQTGSGRNRKMHYLVVRPGTRVLAAGGAITFTDVSLSVFVPPGVALVFFQLFFTTATAANRVELRNNANPSTGILFLTSGVAVSLATFLVSMTCDDSRIIEYKVTNAADDATIDLLGYEDEL